MPMQAELIICRSFLSPAYEKRIFYTPYCFHVFSNTNAASFDCKKAIKKIEKMICASTEISALDNDLAEAYKTATNGTGDSSTLVIDQKEWLQLKRASCKNQACLRTVYQNRIE
jgi:uncharacterized protein